MKDEPRIEISGPISDLHVNSNGYTWEEVVSATLFVAVNTMRQVGLNVGSIHNVFESELDDIKEVIEDD